MKSKFGKFLGLASLTALVASSAFAYGGAVAIVFNPQTGAYGSFHGANSRQAAEANALNLCGSDCAVDLASLESGASAVRETWAINGWVALAKGDNNIFATAGLHDSEMDAEQSALDRCNYATSNCYIVRSVSSFEYGPDFDGVRNN